jgi:hypothetical protein
MDLALSMTRTHIILIVVGGVILLSIVAGVLGRLLVRRGMREPFVIRRINRMSERLVDIVKRPITIAVLDEVADVLKAGHYTQNIAVALQENHQEIKDMIAEKIREDPTAGRLGLIPFHDRVVGEVTETSLRVILAVLADPRTDEIVSDMLRDNVTQIRQTLRDREAADATL